MQQALEELLGRDIVPIDVEVSSNGGHHERCPELRLPVLGSNWGAAFRGPPVPHSRDVACGMDIPVRTMPYSRP